MFTFKIGNTIVHLWPLIIAFFITIFGVIIHTILLSIKNKKVVELCRTGKFNESITIALKQLNYYHRAFALLKNKNTRKVIESLYLYLAISNFGLSNDKQFICNMSHVNDNNLEKHFWLALFYLLKNDSTNFQTHYEILESKKIVSDYLSYLASIKKLKECDDVNARNVLSALYPKLNFKLLQDISKKIIEQ